MCFRPLDLLRPLRPGGAHVGGVRFGEMRVLDLRMTIIITAIKLIIAIIITNSSSHTNSNSMNNNDSNNSNNHIRQLRRGTIAKRSNVNWGPHKPTPPPPPLFDKFKFGFIKCQNLLNTHKTELVHCNLNLLN